MPTLDHLTSWHSNWRGLRVVVFGLGVSGFSVADTLAELGANVLVVAEKAEADLLDILDVIGVPHITGEAAKGIPAEVKAFDPELVVTSPGVRPQHELLAWAANQNVPVWVDIDLAWRLRDKTEKTAEWLMVTGTNGKTTTVQLVEAMLNHSGRRAIACGNIGTPILDAIRDPQGWDALVVELSSFQLHYMGADIAPHSSAVLNLADDHIDWHGSFAAYGAAKAKVFNNVKVACVYNVGDEATMHMVEEADVQDGARAIGFSVVAPRLSEIGYVDDILCDRAFIQERATTAMPLATLDDLSQIGVVTPHLMANVAAAACLARAIGVSAEQITEAIRNFQMDAHRIELVCESNGVAWYDDSKATNPHAAAASLASFDRVVWVVGGLLKGVDIRPLVETFAKKLASAIVIGVDREPILAAFADIAPNVPIHEVALGAGQGSEVMTEVARVAASIAVAGDTVLLAPAAASMDQFKDYADRGEKFAAAAREAVGESNG